MKSVLYRFQTVSAEDGSFYYDVLTVPSKTKVTEEMCLEHQFGKNLDKR